MSARLERAMCWPRSRKVRRWSIVMEGDSFYYLERRWHIFGIDSTQRLIHAGYLSALGVPRTKVFVQRDLKEITFLDRPYDFYSWEPR
jgi:hypothetical protein